MHGPTFMANPLACAVALASLELLARRRRWAGGRWRERVARSSGGCATGLEPARELPGVTDVRVLGAIGVVELDDDVDVAAATAAAVARGVWLRPFRDLIYTMPPYVIGEEDWRRSTAAVVDAAARAASPLDGARSSRAARAAAAPATREVGRIGARNEARASHLDLARGARSSRGWSAPASMAPPARA